MKRESFFWSPKAGRGKKKKKKGFSSRLSRKMGSSDFNLRETNFIL